jgi:predicted metal-binding membrane protein
MGAGTMQEMGGMTMPMSAWPWTAAHAVLMFFMWLIMMAAMMLPSAAPVILLYGTISRRSNAQISVAPILFAIGYVAVWSCFGLAALFAQFLLEWAELLSPMMEATSAGLSGALLIAAGIYQFTPLKRSCLRICRSPLDFLMSHWRSGKLGAFEMGARHGIYCVACCWGLMLLLFVGGLMNLMWIVGLAVYVLIEKLVAGGQRLAQITGVLLVASGMILLAIPLH